MQVNEHAGQAWHGKRLPDIDRALNDTRTPPETRIKRLSANESRRLTSQPPTRMPPRYGAGF